MITTAIKAAKAAGKILMENYGRVNKIDTKQDSSLVTEVDALCEKKIRDIILSKYPHHNLIGEEEGNDNKESDYKWIIDPLDGTHNYIFKFPMFAVAIGLAHKNDIICGVVHFPLSKDIYTAEKGKGCFLNGKRVSIKDKSLKESLVSMSSWYFRTYSEDAQKVSQNIYKNCFEIRVTGCAVFNLIGVLNSTFGAMVSRSNKDWDVAAGVLMIREAGGIVTDYKGKEWVLGMPNIVAGNKTCHKEVLGLLK